MKFDVICFGSAFADVFLKSDEFKTVRSPRVKTGVAMCGIMGGKLAVDELVMTTGGCATNAAVSFERKGLQAACIACVGNDFWGQFIKRELKNEGVSLIHLQTDKSRQTSCSTILVNQQGRRVALVYRNASNQLAWQKVKWQSLNSRWFYVGSLGGDLALLTKIVRTAQDKKVKIAFNPGSNEIKSRDQLVPFLKQVEVLLLNTVEAAQLTGIKISQKTAMFKKLRKMGPKVIALTQGSQGAWLSFGKKVYKAPVFKVKTMEETGAGDAFGSGLVAGLALGLKPKDAIKLAMANSASVVAQVGSKAGLLWQDEVKAWLKKPLTIR
ncbi:carbohydrate kinase family protein [Patescibacteria group bacterium]|nr:carbohydrate kinase family protein [Patescibacteria group bacterium]MBU1931547.1 carbohydrate kinase family protein [Patescibacteria group bacterium]